MNKMYKEEMKTGGYDIFTRQYVNELLTMFNHHVGKENHRMYTTVTQYYFPGYSSDHITNWFSVFNDPGFRYTPANQGRLSELEHTETSQEDKDQRDFIELNKQRPSVIRRSFCDGVRSSPPREAVMTICDYQDDDQNCNIEVLKRTPLEREQITTKEDHSDTSGRKTLQLDNIHYDYELPPTPESLNHESEAPSSPVMVATAGEEPTTIKIGSKRRCHDNDKNSTKGLKKCKMFVRKRRNNKEPCVVENEVDEEPSLWVNSTDSECECDISSETMCHQDETMKSGKYKFNCSFCHKGFNWFSHWQAHERVHTGERPYKCKYCPRRFKRADGLHCHQIIHTKTKISQCQYCSKVFKKKESREKHLLEHTGIIPYACNYCDEEITETDKIEIHLTKHKGKKRFTCQYCKQTLTNPKALVKHVRGHTGDKLFKCSLCPMTFNKKSALLVHHRVHSGARPYTCTQCNKTFSIKGNLRRHLVIHSGKRPYACDKCDKTYNNPSHLSRHIATQH